ncbi:hypothetical protein [Hafnia paralvei]|uniref:hypothetical protein n=1 Tax=Hafnia paralvei TaxID=546367 RepID=UPI0020331474|nr:hypothetical protein [Hafnia paralvei]
MLIVLLVNLVSFYHAFQNSWIHVEREILSTINEIDTRSYPSENGFGVFLTKEEDQEFRKEQISYIGMIKNGVRGNTCTLDIIFMHTDMSIFVQI